MSRAQRPTTLRAAEWFVIGAGLVLLIAMIVAASKPVYRPPPAFAELPVDQKKREFFDYLRPMVEDINAALSRERERLVGIRARLAAGDHPGWLDRRWLNRLAERLEVPVADMEPDEAFDLLERRLGVVPDSLVLAQAAIESGWGTSRFAVEANNFFGQRCYESGCGVMPLERSDDAGFGLARFDSPLASVESYMMNLNTHPEYRDFRIRRQGLLDSGAPVTGLALVDELAAYSERGHDYVTEVRELILANDLE